MRRRLWIYRRLFRNWIKRLDQRRDIERKLENLSDPGFLDRVK